MTIRRDKELPLALITSLVVHVLFFLLLAWLFAAQARSALERLQAPKSEPEPVLIFPDQIMPVIEPPPVLPKKSEIYIRTTQNTAEAEKPKNAAFISDRNTKASAKLAPVAGADKPMPTTEGIAIPMSELANRDYRDGDIKEDSAPLQKKVVVPAPQQPTAVITPPPPQIAKNTAPKSALLQMMEESETEMAGSEENRLKLEIKKAEQPQMKEPNTPPQPITPQMRETEEVVAKAITIPQEDIRQNAGKAQENSYMPHTRTSENKGTISNRGQEDSVDAEDSPKGRYNKALQDQIGKKWNSYRVMNREAVTYGSLQVIVYINSRGKVQEIRVVNDKQSNPLLTEFSLRAIRDAELPPMPPEVVKELPMYDKKCFKLDYNILIY